MFLQVEEVSTHGLTKQHDEKKQDDDDTGIEEAFAIRHNLIY